MNKLHWIPFKISEKDALGRFQQFHNRILSSKRLELQSIKRVLLPFYAVNVQVDTFVSATTRRHRQLIRHHLTHSWNGLKTPELQIYASDSFNRYLINGIKGDAFLAMQPMDSSGDGSATALAFSMDPSSILVRYISPFIHMNENLRASAFLEHRYGKANFSLNMNDISTFVKWKHFDITSCYFPCYILELEHDGEVYYSYLDGVLGQMSGHRLYDSTNVSLMASLASLLCLYPLSGWDLTLKETISSALLPFLTTKLALNYSPLFSKMYQEHKQNFIYGFDSTELEKSSSSSPPIWWNLRNLESAFHEWQDKMSIEHEAKTWSQYHEFMRNLNSSDQKQFGRAPVHPDPLGLYQIMGLKGREALATSDDIQAAFRLLASKYHPDKYTSANEKSEYSAIFQQLSLAYSVLRNESKRKKYDMSGSA